MTDFSLVSFPGTIEFTEHVATDDASFVQLDISFNQHLVTRTTNLDFIDPTYYIRVATDLNSLVSSSQSSAEDGLDDAYGLSGAVWNKNEQAGIPGTYMAWTDVSYVLPSAKKNFDFGEIYFRDYTTYRTNSTRHERIVTIDFSLNQNGSYDTSYQIVRDDVTLNIIDLEDTAQQIYVETDGYNAGTEYVNSIDASSADILETIVDMGAIETSFNHIKTALDNVVSALTSSSPGDILDDWTLTLNEVPLAANSIVSRIARNVYNEDVSGIDFADNLFGTAGDNEANYAIILDTPATFDVSMKEFDTTTSSDNTGYEISGELIQIATGTVYGILIQT